MEEKMSRWGIGPIFASLSIIYGLITLVISFYFHPIFQISFVSDFPLDILGLLLIVIGIPFFVISVATAMRAYNSDKLVTNGIFRCCRHPLYASWVVFIVPGIVFIVNSWIGLTTPIFMYFVLRILVQKEETYLENAFGTEYLEYKKKVLCILPVGWIKSII